MNEEGLRFDIKSRLQVARSVEFIKTYPWSIYGNAETPYPRKGLILRLIVYHFIEVPTTSLSHKDYGKIHGHSSSKDRLLR